MSVIIKGMNMSKSCHECIMCVDDKYGERCYLTNQYIESIVDNCPLVENPEKSSYTLQPLIDKINALQTYKLAEGDADILISRDDVIKILKGE